MYNANPRGVSRSSEGLHIPSNQGTGTTKKYGFVILIILGFSGLALGAVGLAQAVRAGALTNQAIIMMATGGGAGTLLIIIGIVGLVKNSQIAPPSTEPLQDEEETESSEDQTIEPLKRTEVEGVEGFTVFGAREWKYFYGDVGEEPLHPKGIGAILNADCPFFPNQKVRDTHMLVLVPAKVGGEDLNLNKLRELVKNPLNNGYRTNCCDPTKDIKIFYKKTSGSSYWVLMTKKLIPYSRSIDYNHQKILVEQQGGQLYRLPHLLEAAVCILMEHVVSGYKLFSRDDNVLIYASCLETLDGGEQAEECEGGDPVAIGGFSDEALAVKVVSSVAQNGRGVAALRQFH